MIFNSFAAPELLDLMQKGENYNVTSQRADAFSLGRIILCCCGATLGFY